MRKKGKYTSDPDPDCDSLRQKLKMIIINKMKRAWMWSEGPAGFCQFANARSRPVGPKGGMGSDTLVMRSEDWPQVREKWKFSWHVV